VTATQPKPANRLDRVQPERHSCQVLPNIDQITDFEHRFARAQATHVVELPWGFALLQRDFPLSHNHNRIVVTARANAEEVLTAADDVLGGAGLAHRYVTVDDALGASLALEFAAAGYNHDVIATMVHSGNPAEPGAQPVYAVSPETVRPALIRDWRLLLPDVTDEHLGQLADRVTLCARGADLTVLVAYDGDEIAAHAELYVDRAASLAQFDSLVTHPDFRGRGHGAALVRAALRRASKVGCTLSFLTADARDWPYGWYQRLGYTDVSRSHHFSRP
jgi:GNAT superfamily N-acetyltransferase